MSYDPDPRRRRKHRGPRKGVEPAGLKRWRLAHRTHDPSAARRRKPWHRGPRGGKYWKGPTKRRYDPQRFARVRSYGRRARAYGSKAEAIINRHAGIIGAGLAALIGIYKGYEHDKGNYFNKIPLEYTHLGDFDMTHEWNVCNFLKWKFLGMNPDGSFGDSAWVIPFWASLIGWIASKLNVLPPRYNKPLGGISKGALVVSTIGALTLPGSGPSNSAPSSNQSTRTTAYTYVGR